MIKRIAYQIREWRGLRICNTVKEFEDYCDILETPEAIAWWIDGNIEYDDNELPLRWRTVEDVLVNRNNMTGFQYGNCTEMACLARYGLRTQFYKAEIACVYGEDENRKKKGHVVCCFSGHGQRGVINGGAVKFYTGHVPWAQMVIETVPKWLTTMWHFTDDNGKKISVEL